MGLESFGHAGPPSRYRGWPAPIAAPRGPRSAGSPAAALGEGRDLRRVVGLAKRCPRAPKVCFYMPLYRPGLSCISKEGFGNSAHPRRLQRYLEGKVSLPELTWESLKGRHPAAARRKRALWRGGKHAASLVNIKGESRRVWRLKYTDWSSDEAKIS